MAKSNVVVLPIETVDEFDPYDSHDIWEKYATPADKERYANYYKLIQKETLYQIDCGDPTKYRASEDRIAELQKEANEFHAKIVKNGQDIEFGLIDQKKAEADKAKINSDYEEWKAKQPTVDTPEIKESTGWFSKTTSFLKNNMGAIIGVATVIGGAAALTPTLMKQLSKIQDKIKKKPSKPTEAEMAKIEKNPKSVSLKMYSFIRDSESFSPYVKQNGNLTCIGFGSQVTIGSVFYYTYPWRTDEGITEEYMEHKKDGTLDEWLKGVNPSLIPIDMAYEMFTNSLREIETIINREITDVELEQYEFDALVSFLWSMRGEGNLYPEFQPTALIKELHTLLYYDTREAVAEYMKEVDKRLVLSSDVWNRRNKDCSLFLTGLYESLSSERPDNEDYEEVFSDMKNKYLAEKTKDETLENYESYIGNESLSESLKSADKPIIKRQDTNDEGYNTLPKVVSSNDILGGEVVSSMVYPVVRKFGQSRGGKDNTGINPDNTICYGWFGSERGSGQNLHYGVDLVADKNNPIVMPYSGVIEEIGVASEKANLLKRVVIRPDYNKNIVVSLYYLGVVFVEKGKHYEANELVGYLGDCSPLFEDYAEEGFVPYNYLHIQFNEIDEKGTPINPTSCIMNAKVEKVPEEIEFLKNHPLVYDFENGDKSIKIEHPGLYQILLVGHGGKEISYNLNWISKVPVDSSDISPYEYSVTGSRGAFVNVKKFLKNETFSYSLSQTNGTIFDYRLKAESGKPAFGTNDKYATNTSSKFTIPEDYEVINSAEGGASNAVSNVASYDIETGQPMKFTIIQGLGSSYVNECKEFEANRPYTKGENCIYGGTYYSAKNNFTPTTFNNKDWNLSHSGFGNGGQVGLNGNGVLPPTPGLVYIQYIHWC